MELPSLVHGWTLRRGLVFSLLVLLLPAACHSGAAGSYTNDAGIDRTPDLTEKLPPPEVYCSPDGPGGGGQCPLNFCGTPKSVKALGAGELAELGADVKCTPVDVCVPDGPAANGTALQLRCAHPLSPAAPFGAACTKTAGATNRCKNDLLCIDAPGAPGAPFCSQLCRADADCPTDAYCLEYKSETLPNGSFVNLGFCTPKSKITATACTAEAQCAADQGCVSYGARTALLTCQKLGGTKAVGEACTDVKQCRSGECTDRDFKLGAGHRTFCTAHCAKNSDCAVDQRCVLIVANNNGTPADPFDDVLTGYCQTLFLPDAAVACKDDGGCAAGKTCDTTHGLCYTPGAVSGGRCAGDPDCELGATCRTDEKNYPGGYCVTLGCAPGVTTGVDSCPGADAVCSQRFADMPLGACYEGCKQAGDCSRFAEKYTCAPPTTAPGVPASICIISSGS